MLYPDINEAVLWRIERSRQDGTAEVDLSNLGLTEIPPILSNCTWIKLLNLIGNQISRIENLPDSLQTLYLKSNKVSRIENLPNSLQSLSLNDNQVSQIENLPDSLISIYLSGNPTENIPQELLGSGYIDNCLPDVKAWFADLAQKSVRNNTVKLLITGNGNVGKSSLVEALKMGVCRSEKSSTHGILIDQLSLSDADEPVEFRIFDFGGQEIYHGTHQLFLQSWALQLVAFDAESESNATTPDRITGETIRNVQLPYWVDSIKRLSPESQFLIVRNKIDDKQFSLPPTTKNYLTQWRDASQIYQEVSATSGTGIRALRGNLIEAASKLPEYGMMIPESWDSVRTFFWDNLKKPDRKRLISWKDFRGLCTKQGILRNSESALLRYLHRTGTIYYDRGYLEDAIIADQQWAIEAIYKALDRQGELYDALRNLNAGRCRAKHILVAFGPGYTLKQRWLFLSFMESCSLCFPLKEELHESPNENTFYVFPEFLRHDQPEAAQYRLAQSTHRVFVQQHDFLPYHYIQQLITRWGTKTEIQKIWRTGLDIATSEGWFVLEADLTHHTLKLSVDNAMPEKSQMSLLNQFGYRSKPWQKIISDQYKSVPAHDRSASSKKAEVLTPKTLPNILSKPLKEFVISYARQDKACLELLAKKLSSYDELVVWYDRKLDGQSAWDDQVRSRFESCDGYIILISDDYLDKDRKIFIHQEEIPCILRRFDESIFTFGIKVAHRSTYKTKLEPIPIFDKNGDYAPEGVMPDPITHEREASRFLEAFVQEIILKQFL